VSGGVAVDFTAVLPHGDDDALFDEHAPDRNVVVGARATRRLEGFAHESLVIFHDVEA
jgi:hypothetical protein